MATSSSACDCPTVCTYGLVSFFLSGKAEAVKWLVLY